MSVNVTPVAGKRDFEAFLDLPDRVYAGDPHYVHPLRSELKHFFDQAKNPFWRHATHGLWLARRGDEVVGRIGACADRTSNEHHDERVGLFGFFEVVDGSDAAPPLLKAAEAWAT